MNENLDNKWISNLALLFYQIFSVEYKDEGFYKKLMAGGGGNSALCATWTKLSDVFLKYRISKNAYELLLTFIKDEDKDLISKNKNDITISKKIIYDKYHKFFFNNAKGAEKRKKNGKYFHFDHNPSNKKVLLLLEKKVKEIKDKPDFLNELADYIENIQTVDLITVEEDDIRTSEDLKLKGNKMEGKERDKILNTKFYNLYIVK